ncbi:MAG: hypothetical protein Aurels2KO_46880 [Aureliella sp.]
MCLLLFTAGQALDQLQIGDVSFADPLSEHCRNVVASLLGPACPHYRAPQGNMRVLSFKWDCRGKQKYYCFFRVDQLTVEFAQKTPTVLKRKNSDTPLQDGKATIMLGK